ncbi:MAG: 50S ribosomal protein L13 [Anaerolineae bacterium]|nr:50S ribosomal protein L13 [Chloroflexota bacterium]
MNTYIVKGGDIERAWFVVDAEGQSLGRLATRIATVLRGKHKATYTPSMDLGDFVIVVNAEKVRVTGSKMEDKFYYRHSLYPGGQTAVSLSDMLKTHPERVIEHAVRGMLPKNRLGQEMYRKLKVYAGPEHPHQAQKPQTLDL